jgi:phenylacetate-CoA ligase
VAGSLAERVYFRSPLAVQNVLTSLYGLRLRRERYGGGFSSYLRDLMATQWLDAGQLAALQTRLLRDLLAQVAGSTPFYRELGVRPEDITSLEDLRHFPLLSKRRVREEQQIFVNPAIARRHLTSVHTSGTTGAPLTVVLTKEARRRNYAFFARSKLWAGVGLGDRSVTFAGRVFVPPGATRPPFWRSNWFCRNTLFSSYHLSAATSEAYFEAMKALQPALIDSYPSSVYILARYMAEKGLTGIRPKAIITSSETLLQHQRQLVEAIFGCRVFDQYGSAEQVAFICQCEHGSYHVNPEYGVVELLDARGRPVRQGEVGEITATGFTNQAMPLIRYRTGDMAAWGDRPCNCGRHSSTVTQIEGRQDDLLVTVDGRLVGRLDPVFKGVDSTIAAAQIVQEDYGRIVLRLERGPRYKEADGMSVVAEIKKRLGQEMDVTLEYPEHIARGPGGKFRAVICKVQRQGA